MLMVEGWVGGDGWNCGGTYSMNLWFLVGWDLGLLCWVWGIFRGGLVGLRMRNGIFGCREGMNMGTGLGLSSYQVAFWNRDYYSCLNSTQIVDS